MIDPGQCALYCRMHISNNADVFGEEVQHGPPAMFNNGAHCRFALKLAGQ